MRPRDDRQDHDQRADVEDGDAPRHGVDGLGQGLLGVLGLAGGDADQLDREEGEHHDLQGHQRAADALGEEAAVVPQVGDGGGVGRVGEADGEDAGADQDHADDGGDLDHGEPELQLTEELHGDQVGGVEDDREDQRVGPLREAVMGQYDMYCAAAVTSVMPVTTQNSQYVQPVT